MLVLLLISVACFFALYFTMLTLLRHAALKGRVQRLAISHSTSLRAALETRPAAEINSPFYPAAQANSREPRMPGKRPDWRFLVRDGRRPFPSGQDVSMGRKRPVETTQGQPRADWAFYNKDLGDLNDPYQAAPSTARRA